MNGTLYIIMPVVRTFLKRAYCRDSLRNYLLMLAVIISMLIFPEND